jgi:hypothetical protein
MCKTAEVTGEKCGLCGGETFRLQKRKAMVEVDCCPQCARKLDAEEQTKSDREALTGMGKKERLRAFKEKSHAWACGWHGKYALLEFTYYTNHSFSEQTETISVKGRPFYDSPHEDCGWGRLKFVIDSTEYHHISFAPSENNPKHQVILFDGEHSEFTYHFMTHGGYYFDCPDFGYDYPYAIRIGWGDRGHKILTEIDQVAEEARTAQVKEATIIKNIAEAAKY